MLKYKLFESYWLFYCLIYRYFSLQKISLGGQVGVKGTIIAAPLFLGGLHSACWGVQPGTFINLLYSVEATLRTF